MVKRSDVAATGGSAKRPRRPRTAIKNDPRYQVFMRALGLQIAQVRRERGKALKLTQAQVARSAEIDVSRLSQIENGQAMAATWTLYGLGRALQVQPGAAFLDPAIRYIASHVETTEAAETNRRPRTPHTAEPIQQVANADLRQIAADTKYSLAEVIAIINAISASRLPQAATGTWGQVAGPRESPRRRRARR